MVDYYSDWESEKDLLEQFDKAERKSKEGGNRRPEDRRFQRIFYPSDDNGDNVQRALASNGPTTNRPVTKGELHTTQLATSHPEETTLIDQTSVAPEEVTTAEDNIVTHPIFEEFTTEEGNSTTNSTVAAGGGFIHTIAALFHVTDPIAILILILIGILIIIIIIVCCCRCCRKKEKKVKKTRGDVMPVEGGDSDDDEREATHGKMTYSLEYDTKKKSLKVSGLQCTELPNITGTTIDPYITLYIEYKDKRKTSPDKTEVKDGSNPSFKKHFEFNNVKTEELATCTLVFQVFDKNDIGRDPKLAEHRLSLSRSSAKVDKIIDNADERTVKLHPGEELSGTTGDLCVQLMYVKLSKTLKITILEAKKLAIDETKFSKRKIGLYVHVSLSQGKRFIASFNTETRVNTINPYYNQTFEVRNIDNLENLRLKAIVYIPGPLPGMKKCIGQCIIGDRSGQWIELRKNQTFPIAMWHPLYEGSVDPDAEPAAVDKKGKQASGGAKKTASPAKRKK